MKKILVISWFYPPVNSSEGIVTFKLINNSKYSYDVFTQNRHNDWTYGNTVEFKNQKNVKSIYSNCNSIYEWMEDAYQYFAKNADKYDIVMTRAMPQESHIIGLRIKRDFPNVKWIASFGDPIKNNPYHHISCYLYSYYSTKNLINKDMSLMRKLSIKRNLKCLYWNIRYKNNIKLRNELNEIEEQTLKYADFIVLNNESQKKYMLNNNQSLSKKAFIINHSYDSKMYPKITKTKHDKIRFVFIGHLDEIRNASPLLRALSLLNKEIPDLKNKIEVFFYGDMGNEDKLFILNEDLLDIVKIKKSVSYLESLKIMKDADWLIHIDGNIIKVIDENIFFAAKIVDYFGSGSNILAITMQNGDAVDTLQNANALVLSYSCEEIKNYLYLIVQKGYTRNINKEFVKKFEVSKVSSDFDDLIKLIRKDS